MGKDFQKFTLLNLLQFVKVMAGHQPYVSTLFLLSAFIKDKNYKQNYKSIRYMLYKNEAMFCSEETALKSGFSE